MLYKRTIGNRSYYYVVKEEMPDGSLSGLVMDFYGSNSHVRMSRNKRISKGWKPVDITEICYKLSRGINTGKNALANEETLTPEFRKMFEELLDSYNDLMSTIIAINIKEHLSGKFN